MSDDPCRCPDECRYFCSIHQEHHVVPGLVESCLEKATKPTPSKRVGFPLAG